MPATAANPAVQKPASRTSAARHAKRKRHAEANSHSAHPEDGVAQTPVVKAVTAA